MDLIRLGAVIDPTEAVAGAKKAKAAANDMATSMVDDLNRVEKESTEAGKAVNKAGETIERAAREARQETERLGEARGFDRLRQQVGSSFTDIRRMVIDVLDVFGLLNNGIGDLVRRGDSLLNVTENARRGFGNVGTGARAAASGVGELGGSTGAAASGMGRMLASAGPLIAILAAVAAAVLAAVVAFKLFQGALAFTKESVKEAAALEQYTVRLAVLQGSFEKAAATVKRFNQFSDTTPFTDAEVFDAGTKLEAMSRGVLSTDEALRAIGGSAFVAGKGFSEIAELVGRSYNALRLGLDFIEPLKTMNSYGLITGETVKEVIRLGEEAEKTGNKAANFAKQWALVYGELQTKQEALVLASNTWEGKMSTIEGKWQALKAAFGEPIINALKPVLDDVINVITMLTPMAAQAGEVVGIMLKTFVQLFKEGKLSEYFIASFLDATETIARFILAAFLQSLAIAANTTIDLFLLPFRLIADGFKALLADPGMVARLIANINQGFIDAVKILLDELVKAATAFTEKIESGIRSAVASVGSGTIATVIGKVAGGASPAAAIVDTMTAKAAGAVVGDQVGKHVAAAVTAVLPDSAPATNPDGLTFYGPAPAAPEPKDYFSTSLFPETLLNDLKLETSRTQNVVAEAVKRFDAANPAPVVLHGPPKPEDPATTNTGNGTGTGEPSASAKQIKDITDVLQEQRTAVQSLTDDWLDLKGQADQTIASMAQGIAGSVSQAITDGITGTKSWKEAFADLGTEVVKQIIGMITQMWVQYTVALLLKNVMGALPGGFGLFGGAATAVLHTGGSTEGAPTRGGVPFYHSGGKSSSERLAMLEKDETVLTAEQGSEIRTRLRQGARARSGGRGAGTGGSAVTILNVTDANQVNDAIAANPDIILNAINRRQAAVRRVIQGDRR